MTCNFHWVEIREPGTITDLVQDAADAGYNATIRLVRDWTAKGLLDAPLRRPSGRGKGSRPALYRPSQRMLLLTLLHHRQEGLSIPGLARIPVALWLYFPTAQVSNQQAHRAFVTWLADPRSTLAEARRHALEMAAQLASTTASQQSRKTLESLLVDIAYRGKLDDEASLRIAIRNVFEPDFDGISKALGHPSAPLSTEAIVDIIRAKLEGMRLITQDRLGLADFVVAGRQQRESMQEYVTLQPSMAAAALDSTMPLYDEPSTQWLVDQSCASILTIVGLRSLAGTG